MRQEDLLVRTMVDLAENPVDDDNLVELVEVQAEEGPCFHCCRTGEAVTTAELAAEEDRWPRFAPVALAAGFRSVHAVPVRVQQSVIGAINLFDGLVDMTIAACSAAGRYVVWCGMNGE